MKKALFIILLLPTLILAQEKQTKVHPIDKWLDECMSKPEGQSTAGTVECAEKAYSKWDSELNKIYKSLMTKLKPEDQKTLKETQRAWIKFRDEEFKLLDAIYGYKEGTMYIPMHVFDRIKIISSRVKDLGNYFDLLYE